MEALFTVVGAIVCFTFALTAIAFVIAALIIGFTEIFSKKH